MCIITMICWGSWANTTKLVDEKNGLFVDDGFSLGVYPVNYERTFMVGFNARF